MDGRGLLDTFRDQIRRFNAGGDFFEMHLTDREDYVEWYASVSTGPILPPHMRIGSNYASRGGQAASRIAELRRYLDTLIRERDTSFSIFFLSVYEAIPEQAPIAVDREVYPVVDPDGSSVRTIRPESPGFTNSKKERKKKRRGKKVKLLSGLGLGPLSFERPKLRSERAGLISHAVFGRPLSWYCFAYLAERFFTPPQSVSSASSSSTSTPGIDSASNNGENEERYSLTYIKPGSAAHEAMKESFLLTIVRDKFKEWESIGKMDGHHIDKTNEELAQA
ncbi:hypothetical protein M5K25_028254 [Dendrobium thyrsiflorum]|uniref:Uncharacterized protein n=1 Tax=Dendrobium thyrsiflorum TaxID=117978 RepID=A0ABD0TTQ4_DENTH